MAKETKTRIRKKSVKIAELIDKLYRNTAPLLVGEALVFAVVAILMMIRPIAVMSALTFVIGAALVIFGLYRVSMVFVSELGFSIGTFDVFFGLVTMILGIVFCVYPHDAAVSVVYVFVVLFFLNALRLLLFAINMARMGLHRYWIELIVAILMILLSGWLFLVPNLAIGILVWYLAIYLLLYAAADIHMFILLLWLRHRIK